MEYSSDDSNPPSPFSHVELPESAIVEDLTLTRDDDIDSESNEAESSSLFGLENGTPPIVIPRAYQLEMVEESLKRNIVVAMDTGSGKTHIAVLRIQEELLRIPAEQFIWFLAPTVSLCLQQYEYLCSQITAVQCKFLSGNDGVDRWTEQSHWDSVLKNIKVVVTTYQILLDALSHAFVRMESLALIVIDEAHNCVGKNAGAQIMQKFYHPRKSEGSATPYILGLTASPVMRSDPNSLNRIENTLDAICRTPTKHRSELRAQVKMPILSQILYQSLLRESSLGGYTRALESLGQVFASLNILEDPYVRALRSDGSEKSNRQLQKVLSNYKTWSQNQIKRFHGMCLRIFQELGAWATDYYISEVITRFLNMVDADDDGLGIWDVSTAEKRYLANALRQVSITRPASEVPVGVPLVSDKFTKLVDTILHEAPGFAGIVFVQERAMVSVLAQMLTIHPKTRIRFQVGTMVGTSDHGARPKEISELVDAGSQKNTLLQFKRGELNLVIATSVLEEGIDVPACNHVICFQKPANLKSFVQRRGRARQRDSKLVLLLDTQSPELSEWQRLEENMRKLYEDDMRSLQELLRVEDAEEHDDRQFRVDATGALLDLDNALAHIYHFCAALPKREYVDSRPEFICEAQGPSTSRVKARVVLPLSVTESVRTANSQKSWLSEKNAIKDCAFEAYLALYKAGLVNENLLPLLRHDAMIDELVSSMVESRPSIVSVKEQINPWVDVAAAWKSLEEHRAAGIEIEGQVRRSSLTIGGLKMQIHLPIDVPRIAPFLLYWDEYTELAATLSDDCSTSPATDLSTAMTETWSLLSSAFGARFPIHRRGFVALFTADGEKLLQNQMGCQPVSDFVYAACLGKLPPSLGLVRDRAENNRPYIYKSWLAKKPPMEAVQFPYADYIEALVDVPHLSLTRLTRRSDFLHKIASGNTLTSHKPLSYVLPASRCSIDYLPFKYVQFAMLIPSIMHRFEVYLLADRLSESLLKGVGIKDLNLIVTALSASSAHEATNYQRLEFLGDSILKICTSVQLMGEYPLWHEGYLSAKKDRLVANSRLARAALETGLDGFIITKPFTGHKWRPLYVDNLLSMKTDATRDLSSKVLADVVEALIGAAMIDGGIKKALACMQVFLPELKWQPLENRQASLYARAPVAQLPAMLEPLEQLIGYKFNKKSLLVEAMTHASCNSGSLSLERLEFLGDSVLDNIVVEAVFGQQVQLTHAQMHLLRTALVNADFLAHICMEWKVKQEKADIVQASQPTGDKTPPVFREVLSTVHFPLWRFMRHMSQRLSTVQHATSRRHEDLRHEINAALLEGTHYPWHLLARLQAEKFFSDIVESILGAVWIDSGSLDVCREVVERMGILSYLRRILRDKVHVLHPKEELGMLADNEAVKYVIGSRVNKRDGTEQREYLCKVLLGVLEETQVEGGTQRVFVERREVVQVDGGVSKEEVKTKAAEMAVAILKSEKQGCGAATTQDEDEDEDDMDIDDVYE